MATQRRCRARLRARLMLLLVSICTVAGFVIPPEANAALLPNLLPKKPLNPLMVAVDNTLVSVQNLLAQTETIQANMESAAAALQAEAERIVAEGQADPNTIAPNIQALPDSDALSGVQGQALSLALSLAAKVAAPVCSIIGAVAAETAGLGQIPTMPDYSIFGPLASVVKQYDKTGADTLRDFYLQAYAQLLSPIALPAPLDVANPYVALAQALLTLIKTNWHTEYYPPDGGAPVPRDTPGFLFLPTLIDVDGNLGYDVCANAGLDLTTGDINQQIDRIPLADPKMRANVRADLVLGVISAGYETPAGSFIPSMYQTDHGIAGAPFATKVNLPGAALTQFLSLTSALQFRIETEKTPETYSLKSSKPGGTTGNGTQYNWAASSRANRFSYTNVLSTLNLGIGATPAPTALEYCTSAKNFCSNDPTDVDTVGNGSMHFISRQDAHVAQFGSAAGKLADSCPSTAILGDAHLHGTRLFLSHQTGLGGRTWIDTDDAPLRGCLATASTTGTLPEGFKAQDRLTTFATTGSATTPPVASKTGSITCPTGTAITGGTLGISFGLARYLCAFPPTNTVAPVVTGQTYLASQLSTNNGTWTPGAPNTPTFTYKWQRCDTAGANCADIAGATATTYTVTTDDMGKTLRSAVTATNADGTATAYSSPGGTITLPPAPANTAPPTITGLLGSGQTLTANKGTWVNAPASFNYQWISCDAGGNNCADIAGATGTTYVVQAADEGREIKVAVTGVNLGGTATATSATVRIPGQPLNTVAPQIKNGAASATGQNVFHGDTLKAVDGSWFDANSFTHQWLRCDAGGANCAPITGATGSTYKTDGDDVGSTIGLIVTGHNDNAAPNNAADASAPLTGLVLANSLLPKPISNVPDGTINASTPSDRDTSFVAGSFDTVGKIAGKGGAVGIAATPTDGQYPFSLDAQAKGGVIKASIPDGSGGFFIGGSFTSVRGIACAGFAHLTASGLDEAYCGIGGLAAGADVRALNQMSHNKAIGIGGLFTGSDGHKNFFVVDPTTSPVTVHFALDGEPNGPVNAITNNAGATSNNFNFYVGGDFDQVGNDPRGSMVAYSTGANPMTGLSRFVWNGGVCNNSVSGGACTSKGEVRALSWTSLGVLTGGKFNAAYMTATYPVTTTTNRSNAADISAASGGVLGWNPNANGPVNAITGVSNYGSSTGTGSGGPYTVYLGGEFTKIGPNQLNIPYLAEFGISFLATSAGQGTANNAGPSTTFVPAPNAPVTTLLAGPATCSPAPCAPAVPLYVGGTFTQIAGQARNRVALISGRTFNNASAATLENWAPHAGQQVNTLSRDANNVYIGGALNVLGGVIRKNVAEIGPDGSVGAWAPAGTDGPVNAVLVKNGLLYVGGSFLRAGTDSHVNIAAFDTTTGATAPFNPSVSTEPGTLGAVNALASSPNGLYVGGEFNTVNATTRNGFAELGTDGVLTALDPSTDGRVFAIAASGGVVYLGGQFSTVAGQPRSNVAALNQADGTLSTWTADTNGLVRAIEVGPNGVFIGGDFTSVAGNTLGSLVLVGLDGTVDTAYAANADGSVRTIKAVGNRVFVGGDFLNIGGQARSRAAQLEADGTATGFLPEPSAEGNNASVNAITYSGTNVLGIFGFFDTISSTPTIGLGFYGA